MQTLRNILKSVTIMLDCLKLHTVYPSDQFLCYPGIVLLSFMSHIQSISLLDFLYLYNFSVDQVLVDRSKSKTVGVILEFLLLSASTCALYKIRKIYIFTFANSSVGPGLFG